MTQQAPATTARAVDPFEDFDEFAALVELMAFRHGDEYDVDASEEAS
ncbi:MAG: hypothetical protein OXC11_14220 [Rhodospirillales bacterium]|nr:hypothetical protein [Rhodospirillales bacterium]